ncbi:MAG: GIY-YIG nuclease family protein [Elusimicrobiota bacterium]
MNDKHEYSVYMLHCAGNTLYTGIAKNVQARLKQHKGGKGAAYTRSHLPVRLVYQEDGFTRSEALIREAKIRTMPPKMKRALASL